MYKIWWVGSEGTGEVGGCPLLVDKLSKADRSIGMVLKKERMRLNLDKGGIWRLEG